jgi:hypothetical protein
VPNKRLVEIDEFETKNPALRGEMKVTIELFKKERRRRAEVVGVHEGLPPGLSGRADNEMGWRMALEKLASFVTASLRAG